MKNKRKAKRQKSDVGHSKWRHQNPRNKGYLNLDVICANYRRARREHLIYF